MLCAGAFAQGNPQPGPDLRIVLIDDTLFAGIAESTVRHEAIDDMLRDIVSFEQTAPSRGGVIVFHKQGAALRPIRELDRNSSLEEGLRTSRAFEGMRDARNANSVAPGINLGDVRNVLLNAVRRERPQPRSVDVHVFANEWYWSDAASSTNFQQFDHPSYCVELQDSSVEVWPENIILTLEFRPPETAEIPSESAQANMATFLSGNSASQDNVLTRGVSGPRCPMGDGVVAQGFLSNAPVPPDCSDWPQPRADDAGNALACRHMSAPPLGTNMALAPVSLRVSTVSSAVGHLELVVGTRPSGQSIDAQLGGLPILPGRTTTLSGQIAPGIYDGRIEVAPDAACREPGTWAVDLLSTPDELVRFVVSQPSCVGHTLQMPRMEVQ